MPGSVQSFRRRIACRAAHGARARVCIDSLGAGMSSAKDRSGGAKRRKRASSGDRRGEQSPAAARRHHASPAAGHEAPRGRSSDALVQESERVGNGGVASPEKSGSGALELVLAAWFAVFVVTSLIFEAYVVFDVDIATRPDGSYDPFLWCWWWYATSFDPLFLRTPLWLRVMCGIDMVAFGPFHAVLVRALTRKGGIATWGPGMRAATIAYVSAIVYSTVVYFGAEAGDWWEGRDGHDMLAVLVVNIPWTIVPLVLLWAMLRA